MSAQAVLDGPGRLIAEFSTSHTMTERVGDFVIQCEDGCSMTESGHRWPYDEATAAANIPQILKETLLQASEVFSSTEDRKPYQRPPARRQTPADQLRKRDSVR